MPFQCIDQSRTDFACPAGPVRFVHLSGSREVIEGRMAKREGHYMPVSLLDSQFAALEAPAPDEALSVDIDQSLAAIVARILPALAGDDLLP